MSHPNTPAAAETTEGAEPIAIIGVSTRVPGAADNEAFWRNLVDGVESITWYSRDQQLATGASAEDVDDPAWVSAAPALDDLEYFDAGFFGMNAKEAELCDPQQRLFLENVSTALEDAGYDPARYPGDIGVYGGTGTNAYRWTVIRENRDISGGAEMLASSVGNSPDYLATLVSYKLNLRGPSFTLHTACSTSLVATHLACEALRNGECEMAVAGGVCVELPHGQGYLHEEGGVTSPDGHCRPFDAKAAGTMWGSGVGVVLLKRLSDAIADGDTVRAVILGNAVNNDGAAKVGFTAPSAEGQTEVVAQALGVAGIDPRTVSYVEAHGTGTGLGDPIEVSALSAAYGSGSDDTNWCGIGSVKSNIGHLSQAAGVVGLAKTVFALEHELIPPTINFESPNPAIDFDAGPFYVASSLTKWGRGATPRRAGVSSFGIGGTNAHVIIEEAPAIERRRTPRPAYLLELSARTPAALEATATRLADRLESDTAVDLADVAFTLRVGRGRYRHRAAVVATDLADAVTALRTPRRRVATEAAATAPGVAFLFPGQGAQYAGMGAELYRTESVYAAAVDECAALLAPELGRDLRELLHAAGDADADAALRDTALTQPALFVVEYALAMLWESWGVRPDTMVGHSIGEYVAATLAGVFTLPDALRLVATRGRLMGSMPTGSMLAVQLGAEAVAPLLPEALSIATINGPGTCVVAGPTDAVEAFAVTLRDRGTAAKALRTSHAFHSAMMDPVLADYTAAVAAVPRRAPGIRFVSNLTGTWITAEQATDPGYWADQLRNAVRFGDCVATLLADGAAVLLECGPGKQLSGLARMQLAKGATAPVPSLPGPSDRAGDVATVSAAYGRLWSLGVAVDETAFGGTGYRIPLPTYPFERAYHWAGPREGARRPAPAAVAAAPDEPTGPLPLDDWFSVPVWRQEFGAPVTTPPARALVIGGGPDGGLAAALRAAGTDVVEVVVGDGYAATDAGFALRPDSRDDWQELLAALAAAGGCPERVVYALPASHRPGPLTGERLDAALTDGFHGLLALVQALAAAQVGAAIDVVTRGAQDVLGGDLVAPEYATVEGVVKVVGAELPAVTLRAIDLDPADTTPGRLVAALAAPAAPLLALRGERRYRQDFQPVPVTEAEGGLRTGGTYLITGGLGGIGITLAEDLGRRFGANLVLTARTGLPDRDGWDAHRAEYGDADRAGRAIAAIRRIEAAGGRVLVVAADVTSADDLRRVRAETLDRFGALHGIVHSAGVPGGGMAEVKRRDEADRVLAPKLAGTLALRDAFGDLPLDFVVLCSSITAVIGGFGQVDYCAANAFLDAFARADHGFTGRVVSVNWGGWTEVGMAAEAGLPAAFRALATGRPVEHPTLRRVSTRPDGTTVVAGTVSAARQWVLDEHRIAGVPVLPGTGHVEHARAAVVAAGAPDDDRLVELRDLVFLEPMSVAEQAEIRVELAGEDLTIVSVVDGAVRTHVRGSAARVTAPPAPRVDLAAIRDRCVERPVDGPFADPDAQRDSMLTFGPRWDAHRAAYTGTDEELALIEAPEAARADLADWVLHPALLDVATSFGQQRGSGQYLPLSYGRVLVRAPLPARFYSHLRYRSTGSEEVIASDLTLLDESGDELVSIADFVLRRVDSSAMDRTVHTAPAPGPPADAPAEGIAPADGATAFRRIVALDLGHQVAVAIRPVAEVLSRSSRVTTEAVEETPAAPTGAVGADAGRSEIESTLVTIWQEILDVAEVGVDDDFFELGGNSLVAVQLIARARRAVGVRLPMRTLFETPTVAGMAERIEQIRAESAEAPAPAAETAAPTIARLPRAQG